MAALHRSLVAMLVATGLAGCNEPKPESRRWSPVATRADAIRPVSPLTSNPAPTTIAVTPPENLPPPVSVTNEVEVITHPAALRDEREWVSFEAWSEENHLGRPQRLLSATNLTYELVTTNGVIALTLGSTLARFNGLTCLLAYPPRISNGLFMLHVRDAEKNVLPLSTSLTNRWPAGSTVVIDPGHGGENPGTRCLVNDQYEKDLTLDWALRLRPLLEANGWHVVLTRTNDLNVTLADRVAIAERHRAALFVSLHFNSSFPKLDQRGIETFCLTPEGMPSNLVRDFEDDLTQVFPNNAFDEQNVQLAMQVHATLIAVTGSPDRGVRRARFMGVLRGQNRPAVLIEGGYLSNPAEAGLIATPEYRQRLAEGVFKALPQPGIAMESSLIQGESQ